MPLETGSFINDLTPANPLGSDPAGQGDDHLRLIKSCVQGSLPNMGGVIGQYRRQDTNTSISATWNTAQIRSSASATTTVTHTLPLGSSITAGWYCDITTGVGANVVLTAGVGNNINGGATFTIPEQNGCHVVYLGGNAWSADIHPLGQISNVFRQGLDLRIGEIKFPATFVGSSDPNTLDDYEEGTFTPVFTYGTPGTFSVTYSTQAGRYVKIGRWVWIDVELTSATYVRGTAAGLMIVAGFPFLHAAETSYAPVHLLGFGLTVAAITYNDPEGALSGSSAGITMSAVDHNTGNAINLNANIVPGSANSANFQMCYRT